MRRMPRSELFVATSVGAGMEDRPREQTVTFCMSDAALFAGVTDVSSARL